MEREAAGRRVRRRLAAARSRPIGGCSESHRPILGPYAGGMAILRMDNVGIVFDDLDAAVAFFVELGLVLEGRMTVEGEWSDRIVGLDGQRVDVAMMRT